MSPKKSVLVVLADGFEEIEAVTPVDVFRRAELDVTVAGLGKTLVTGAHGLAVQADIDFDTYSGAPDALVLPGGMPGASNLAASPKLAALIRKTFESGKIVAAICASPAVVLAPLGILADKKATCYPGFEDRLGPKTTFTADRVVREKNVITSRGPGTAIEFALAITSELAGKSVAERVSGGMMFPGIRA